MNDAIPAELRREVAAAARAAGLAVVATSGASGRPQAALVDIVATDSGELLFNTHADARKVANLARSPAVAVVVGWTGAVSFQIEGTAELLSGAERLRCAAEYEAQQPGSRVLHPDFPLYRVRPTWIRTFDGEARPPEFLEHGARPE